MEAKEADLNGKLKALNLTLGRSEEAISVNNSEALTRQEASITNKIKAVYTLKEDIENE